MKWLGTHARTPLAGVKREPSVFGVRPLKQESGDPEPWMLQYPHYLPPTHSLYLKPWNCQDSFHYTFYSCWQQTQWDAQIASHSSNFYTQQPLSYFFLTFYLPSFSVSDALFLCSLGLTGSHQEDPLPVWKLPLSFYLAVPWGHHSPTPALSSGVYFLPHSQTTGLRGRVESYCFSLPHLAHCPSSPLPQKLWSSESYRIRLHHPLPQGRGRNGFLALCHTPSLRWPQFQVNSVSTQMNFLLTPTSQSLSSTLTPRTHTSS